MCLRKWYFIKIDGLPTPTTKAQATGIDVHAQLEGYLKTGRMPTSLIARVGLEHLPDPATVSPENVEHEFEFTHPDLPAKLVGIIDLVEPGEMPPRITDHKTTSDFQYCKTEEQLQSNTQAIIYGNYAAKSLFDTLPLHFRHIYYRTRGSAQSRVVEAVLDADLLYDGFERIVSTMHTMKKASIVASADKIEPTPSACSAYGGCPFRMNCAAIGDVGERTMLTGMIRAAKTKEKTKMDIATLRARKAKRDGNTEPSKPIEAAPVEAETVEVTPQPINPPDGTPMDEPIVMAEKGRGRPQKGPFLLDEKTPIRGLKKPELISTIEQYFQNVCERLPDFGNDHSVKKYTTGSKTDLVENVVALMDYITGEQTPPVVQAETEPITEPKDVPVEPQKVASNGSFTLYIGCHPRGHVVTYLDDVLKPLQEQVADMEDVPHYGLIRYNEGSKQVAALLHKALNDEEIPISSHVVADRRMSSDIAIEVIAGHANAVVERIG